MPVWHGRTTRVGASDSSTESDAWQLRSRGEPAATSRKRRRASRTPAPAYASAPPVTCSSGWRRNSRRVATPKLPPAPRRPQSSSAFSSSLAWTTSPSGVTSSAPTRLSQVRPYCAVRWPIPPPRVSPHTPVEPTTPPGVTSPKACVAGSKSSQVEPPAAWAIRASPSTSTLRSSERSITRPPSRTQCPAGLWPPPRTATSSPWARAKSKAVATSSGPRQRAITAGRRSMSALKPRRAAS